MRLHDEFAQPGQLRTTPLHCLGHPRPLDDRGSQLHWSLDVTLAEDVYRVLRDNAAMNLAILRRFVLNLLKLDPTPRLSSMPNSSRPRGTMISIATHVVYVGRADAIALGTTRVNATHALKRLMVRR